MLRYWINLVEANDQLDNEVKNLRLDLETHYPGLELWISIGPSGDLQLSQIVVAKRKQGTGSAVMQELVAFADRNNLIMTLTPDTSYGGSSVTRLKSFYRRFGFRPNIGGRKDFRFSGTMLRRPTGTK